jgi:hypothetical protein
VLSQARGAVWNGFIKKTADQGTIIDQVTSAASPDSSSTGSALRHVPR